MYYKKWKVHKSAGSKILIPILVKIWNTAKKNLATGRDLFSLVLRIDADETNLWALELWKKLNTA